MKRLGGGDIIVGKVMVVVKVVIGVKRDCGCYWLSEIKERRQIPPFQVCSLFQFPDFLTQVARMSKCDRCVTSHTPGRIDRNGTVLLLLLFISI